MAFSLWRITPVSVDLILVTNNLSLADFSPGEMHHHPPGPRDAKRPV